MHGHQLEIGAYQPNVPNISRTEPSLACVSFKLARLDGDPGSTGTSTAANSGVAASYRFHIIYRIGSFPAW